MFTNKPSLIGNLLLTATYTVRAMIRTAPSPLHGAVVHIVTLRPDPFCESTDDRETRFLLDAIVEPAAGGAVWEPGDLGVHSSEAVSHDADDSPCRVVETRVMEGGCFVLAGRRTFVGARRVRLRVAVRSGLTQLCFRHRDACFGQALLPDSQLLAA